MDQALEFASYSASEATKILSSAASELVEKTKETLWAYYESTGGDLEKELNSSV
jgi:hypothetical protein